MDASESQLTNPEAAARHEVLALIERKIEPVKVASIYRLGLLLTAAAMALLPLIYMGLIAAALYGVLWYAVNGSEALNLGSSLRFGLVAYVGPLTAGVAMVFFMIKPLLAPRRPETPGQRLEEAAEPLLFAFVRRVCGAVGAPAPREIRVDLQVNASAALRSGLAGFFGNDLRLTVGLPLAGGTSLRELSGVLAHEFGHFSQRAGMRLVFLIWAVNSWFDRVVHERDAWDERLEALARQRIGILLISGNLALVFVWATRKILQGLMWLGQAISCFMSRQMEFDADLHEIRLVGSRTFETTSRRIGELTFGMQTAVHNVNEFWEEGRLADDLPKLAVTNAAALGAEQARVLDELRSGSPTGWLDTHPSDSDRRSRAREENSPGVFRSDSALSDASASILFSDFAKLCRQATLDHYRGNLPGKDVETALRPVEDLLTWKKEEAAFDLAIQEYFHPDWDWDRPLTDFDPGSFTGGSPREAGARLAELRAAIHSGAEAYGQALSRWRSAENSESPEADEEALRAYEALMAERLRLALGLGHGGSRKEELERLLPAALTLSRALPEVVAFSATYRRLRECCDLVIADSSDEARQARLRAVIGSTSAEYRGLRGHLGETRHPFEHPTAGLTLRDHLAPVLFQNDDLGEVIGSSQRCIDKTRRLYRRVMARLAVLAHGAESAADGGRRGAGGSA